MIIERPFSIRGVGKYLPKTIVSSETIEQNLGLPNNWIRKFIGVESRYIAQKESNTEMGANALKEALISANMGIADIDCLIAAAATFDYVIPNRSSLIKNEFEEAANLNFPTLDINTVCTSFITAIDYAAHLLASDKYENIAIVSSEISSKGLNPSNAESFSLFGDVAAAVILSKTTENAGLIKYDIKTYSEGVKNTIIEGGGNRKHPKNYPYDPELYSFKMEGRKLLKIAKKQLPLFLNAFFDGTPTTLAAVNWIIPHQASKMGFKILANLNGCKAKNVINQLAKYGNCIAASIPLALVTSIEEGKIKDKDSCMLIGTAAGMSISGLLLQYSSK